MSAEDETLNLMVVGSSPTLGAKFNSLTLLFLSNSLEHGSNETNTTYIWRNSSTLGKNSIIYGNNIITISDLNESCPPVKKECALPQQARIINNSLPWVIRRVHSALHYKSSVKGSTLKVFPSTWLFLALYSIHLYIRDFYRKASGEMLTVC